MIPSRIESHPLETMYTHKHYVPILKAKRGELKALNGLFSRVTETITPLLEIVPPNPDPVTKEPKKSPQAHCEKVVENILQHWGTYAPFFVDPEPLKLKAPKKKKEQHYLEFIFGLMRSRELKAIPVTGVFHGDAYQQAAAKVIQSDQRGVCLRLRRAHFTAPDRNDLIEDTLKSLGCRRAETDLIVDFGAVTEEAKGQVLMDFAEFTAGSLGLAEWRTFTFAASSFPAILPGDTGPVQCKIVRVEWALWRLLMAVSATSLRKPAFGDYGIVHPVHLEYKPRKMRASRANLRYTADDSWMILRSASVPKAKVLDDPPPVDLHLHQHLCQKLIGMPNVFSGRDFSQGDERIELCASNPTWTKESSEWLYVGTNHHITKVVDQIATTA